MARSKNNQNNYHNKNNMRSATPLVVAKPVRLAPLSQVSSVTLRAYEDRRTYHPNPYTRPAFALPRSAAALVATPQPVRRPSKATHPGASLPRGVSFAVPDRVAICVRRKRRKEVLHALKVAGGRGKQRTRRMSSYSKVSC